MQNPEFSRRLPVHRGVEPVQSFAYEANADERAALAKRFGIIAIDSFAAEGTLATLDGGRRASLRGRVRAHVVQSCVVTLEPVGADIDESFALDFADDAAVAAIEKELELDPEAADPPDPLEGEAVDVGEAAAEQLALALDPYPRAPGAVLPGKLVGESAGETLEDAAESEGSTPKNSPFKALARLVRKSDK
ncbi:MAG: YceD family protein [Alphaproteobacteria bacterium]